MSTRCWLRTLAKVGNRPGRSVLLALGLLLATGCTRGFYRRAADREVNDILAEKDKDPRWKIEQYHVYPDPRARFADPTKPDRPPMPPDDEAAYKLSPHPQGPGKPGVGTVQGTAYLEMIREWDGENRAQREAQDQADGKAAPKQDGKAAAKPDGAADDKQPVQSYFNETLNVPGFLLKLDQSVELGVVNSRQYQTFREELYQAALLVTQQRFSFAAQWMAMTTIIRQWVTGRSASGSGNNWTINSSVGFTKLFSTGALLTFDYLNNTIINLGGGKTTSTSTINLSLLQPLLQGGGRAVTLEPLTQAERNMLYSIRSYARFREQFYVSVALGSSPPSSLPAAVAAGTATSPISTLAALGLASTDVAGGFVGYLSTLYREADMAADKKYVRDLERALRIYEGYQEGGQFSPLQVDQVRSTLLQARNTVLTDIQFMNNALDQFKLLLGLPANLPLVLDDGPVRPITRQYDRYYAVIADSDAAHKDVERQERLDPNQIRPYLLGVYTKSDLVRGTRFQKELPAAWERWRKASPRELEERLRSLRARRTKLLDLKTDLELKGQSLSAADAAELRRLEREFDLGRLEQALRAYELAPWEKQPRADLRVRERGRLFRLVAYSAEIVLVWPRNERFDALADQWPALPGAPLEELDLSTADVEEGQRRAVQVALASRWDLMNARAQVVDAWRQLRVTANALLGVFNVGYNLNSVSPGATSAASTAATTQAATSAAAAATTSATTQALSLVSGGATTTQQLTFNIQLPLNRLLQRNAYRNSLINYQQARRNLMALEDNIAAQVRFDVRQLQLFAANYKIQQRVLHSLYAQVESALELITAPADPTQLQATGTTGQANAAALTNQYLTALNQLNNAQTRMYDIWLSYLATRMQLYLDLERLRMDNRGVWLDEVGGLGDVCPGPGGPPAALPAQLPATAEEIGADGLIPPPLSGPLGPGGEAGPAGPVLPPLAAPPQPAR